MKVPQGKFVVLKFGGTSVSSASAWKTISSQTQQRIESGLRPVLVCSALTGVTNLLERLLAEALHGRHETVLSEIRDRHMDLGQKLGIDPEGLLQEEFQEIARLVLGASLVGEVGPRLRARVCALGEICSTKLGALFLDREGISTSWLDARECLVAVDDPSLAEARRFLSATVSDDYDEILAGRLLSLNTFAIITQGFIARDSSGASVLLGRGGSDTSASYFAAKLGAVRCEIWTDVPGIFSADPRLIPDARLLLNLDYDEAQEVASMGAKVLHPRSIAPCRRHDIPLHLRWTERPNSEGTLITRDENIREAQVKAISYKAGVTLVSMETAGMWQQVGFLAEVFSCFKAQHLSIDLVSTSEMNVTVSLDPTANALGHTTLQNLTRDLSRICKVEIIGPCAAVSLVGHRIRATLYRLGPALSVFEERHIHLVSQAASDLNLTFVVDEMQAERLVRDLHTLLFGERRSDALLGPTWRELFDDQQHDVDSPSKKSWWRVKKESLLHLAQTQTPLYVYDQDSIEQAIAELGALSAIDRILYSVKANACEQVLTTIERAGLGFECVSIGEIRKVLSLFPNLAKERILFTPNFISRPELQEALGLGVHLTIDSLYPLEMWPDLKGRFIFIRLDPGRGRGHHHHVQTAGVQSKFGIARDEMDRLQQLIRDTQVRVVGLHAHVGSGILTPETWSETALFLIAAAEQIPEARILDLGGGLGIAEKPAQSPLDVNAMGDMLSQVKKAHPEYQLWIEPGRFLVARAGALLGTVTQIKKKGDVIFVGTDVGMNSLIRPALYGSYHEIVNLSRLGQPKTTQVHVVGPICESGDVLGHSRQLPSTQEGDILLFANTGAYGRVMSSWYNLREPAKETILPN